MSSTTGPRRPVYWRGSAPGAPGGEPLGGGSSEGRARARPHLSPLRRFPSLFPLQPIVGDTFGSSVAGPLECDSSHISDTISGTVYHYRVSRLCVALCRPVPAVEPITPFSVQSPARAALSLSTGPSWACPSPSKPGNPYIIGLPHYHPVEKGRGRAYPPGVPGIPPTPTYAQVRAHFHPHSSPRLHPVSAPCAQCPAYTPAHPPTCPNPCLHPALPTPCIPPPLAGCTHTRYPHLPCLPGTPSTQYPR